MFCYFIVCHNLIFKFFNSLSFFFFVYNCKLVLLCSFKHSPYLNSLLYCDYRSRSRSFSGSLRGSPHRQLSPARRSPPPSAPRRGSRYRSPLRSPPRLVSACVDVLNSIYFRKIIGDNLYRTYI